MATKTKHNIGLEELFPGYAADLDEDPIAYNQPAYIDEDSDLDDGEQDDHGKKRRRAPDPQVDPIINAGGINVKGLNTAYERLGCPDFLEYAFMLLLHFTFTGTLPPRAVIPTNLPESATAQVKLLLTLVGKDSVNSFMSVFLRMKPGSDQCRIIGHPALLNAAYKPRSLQLCRLADILWGCNLFATPFCIELDFKNYFPQIPITRHLGQFMGVMIEGLTYLQKVLVQGWNGSTNAAQALSWAIMAYTMHDDEILLTLPMKAESPPAFIITENPLSFVAIQYDNILVITGTPELHAKWRTRILRNTARFNCVIKYLNESTNYFSFCGIEVLKTPHYTYRRTDIGRFMDQTGSYPCIPEALTQSPSWLLLPTTKNLRCTPRCIAGMIQIILRQGVICGSYPFAGSRPGPALRAASQLGKLMAGTTKKAWAQPRPELEHLFCSMRQAFSSISNHWYTPPRRSVPGALFIATDARPHITAWVVFDDDGVVIHAGVRPLNPPREISVAETMAVKYAWKDCTSRGFFRGHVFVISGIDNTTASQCLTKEYSGGSSELDEAVTAALKELPRHIHPLFVDLHTDLNVADLPTRGPWSIASLNASDRRSLSFQALTSAMLYFDGSDERWMSRSAVAELTGGPVRDISGRSR